MREKDDGMDELIRAVRTVFAFSNVMQLRLSEFLHQLGDIPGNRDYLDMCYAIHSVIIEDAVRILPVIMLVECNLMKNDKALQNADCILRWIVECENELARKRTFSAEQLSVIQQWIMAVTRAGESGGWLFVEMSDIAKALSAVQNLATAACIHRS